MVAAGVTTSQEIDCVREAIATRPIRSAKTPFELLLRASRLLP